MNSTFIFMGVIAIIASLGFMYVLIFPTFLTILSAYIAADSAVWLAITYFPLIVLIACVTFMISSSISSSGYDD